MFVGDFWWMIWFCLLACLLAVQHSSTLTFLLILLLLILVLVLVLVVAAVRHGVVQRGGAVAQQHPPDQGPQGREQRDRAQLPRAAPGDQGGPVHRHQV
jgi:hypothetical protein